MKLRQLLHSDLGDPDRILTELGGSMSCAFVLFAEKFRRRRRRRPPDVLPQTSPHEYITPPSVPIVASSDVLKQKIEHHWLSGFQTYADSAT